MNKTIVDILDEHKEEAMKAVRGFHNYMDFIVYLTSLADYLDPNRITEIDHGNYQGTLVYVIGGMGYQPDRYWYVKVGYGSCSGCDALEGARSYEDDSKLTNEQLEELYKLLHDIASGIREMNSGVE